MFQHSSPGGTLVAIFDPTTGIIRPVHRAYLCHAHSGEIPLFESHFQRWNISSSEHHSQAPPCIEQTVELPATWNRSLFGPLRGDIKRSFHVFHLSFISHHPRRAHHVCEFISGLSAAEIFHDICIIYPAFSQVEKFSAYRDHQEV